MRYTTLVLGAVLMLPGCSSTFTTVRTITPEEYAARSWLEHPAEDVALAWGANDRGEPDGSGGHVLTYRKVQTTFAYRRSASGVPLPDGPGDLLTGPFPTPNAVVAIDDLAKFWIGSDGKVYRFWFADEVYGKHLDTPSARRVAIYGRKTP
jgi:hypothetical protein